MTSKTATLSEVQTLLHKWRDGDFAARDKLFEKLYFELNKLSAYVLRGEGNISLSAGDLVNEAVIRLIGLNHISWQDKAHFMALASRMMRRVLIDHARKKNSDKREHQRVTLVTKNVGDITDNVDSQVVEHALLRLQTVDSKRAEIVEMRYYGGLTLQEIAEVTGQSPSTVKRNWRISKAYMAKFISEFERF